MICFYKAEAKNCDIDAKIAKSIDNTATESHFFNLFCTKHGLLARLWIPFCLFRVSVQPTLVLWNNQHDVRESCRKEVYHVAVILLPKAGNDITATW